MSAAISTWGQMRAALEQVVERAVRIAQEGFPEFLVGRQPADHHFNAALRHVLVPRSVRRQARRQPAAIGHATRNFWTSSG
jgi:hypothetical protein